MGWSKTGRSRRTSRSEGTDLGRQPRTRGVRCLAAPCRRPPPGSDLMRRGSLRSILVKRLVQLAATLVVVATINFWLFRVLPGSPLLEITREGRLAPAAVRELSNSFGLNRSIGYQYVDYLRHIFTFNTGLSYASQVPVTSLLFPALIHTLILVAGAEFL